MNSTSYRATIPSLPEDNSRPLWSVMIPTYNCANYLRETLASVLAQDPGADVMQIEVVDDCSTLDDPQAVVEELGQGRVNFYRQPQNLGYIQNFETCLKRSRGRLVHLLHGDDCVRGGFYRKLQRGFDENPQVGAAFCRHIEMDGNNHWQGFSNLEQGESGVLSNWLERIAVVNRLQPPSIAVRRDVYEKLGGFDRRICCCAEDWEMWVRISAHYLVWYEVEPLALYRVHSASLTGKCAQSGQNLRDLRKIIEIIQTYLPESLSDDFSSQARENWALYGIQYILPRMLESGDLVAAKNQLEEALKLKCSLNVTRKLGGVMAQYVKRLVKERLQAVISTQR